ncbi:integrase catalytic domain-containing protein [Trichonephila clavipes]|nr:integrase catalytic domain-containing protein [Trichonephila clavipes]
MAFLMIEIDESERDFTRFFWDENPGIDLENKRLDIFRMTRFYLEWKLIQSLRDKFWNRWSTEYLPHLQTRAKWSLQNPNLMENQLVLLKDPNTKPLDWPMGRILEVFPGSDGLVRVVNVKTSTGILKRAITKVVPLPIPVDPATVEKNN